MVCPTYDQLMALNDNDDLRLKAEAELIEVEKIVNELPNGPKKSRLKLTMDNLTMQVKFLLPADFVGTIIAFALSLDVSDIKLVSENMLYEAAILANKGHDNPCDHIHGRFTDFNREDINAKAWMIFGKKQHALNEERKRKNGKRRRR